MNDAFLERFVLVKSVIFMDFFDSAHEMPVFLPISFLVVYLPMIEVGKMNLVWVRSVDIYFVNVGLKVITSRKYILNNYLLVHN